MRLVSILIHVTALIVLMLAGTGAMFGQFGLAMSAECQHTDPNDEKQVFACMSSLRYDRGLSEGRSVFAGKTASNCYGISAMYSTALIKSGVPRDQITNSLPSCATLSKALTEINGQPPYWAGCLNYPGHFDAAHMKSCLETFLPAYSPGRSLQTLNGCADATRTYEFALSEATRLDQNGRPARGLPPGYEKPDCAAVAQMLGGTGSQCLNYQPDAAHIATCLGPAVDRYPACVALRQAYEQKLREAYGGQFPPGYVVLTCDQLSGLTGAAVAKQAALRQAGLAHMHEQVERQHISRPDVRTPEASGGWARTLFFHWLGWPFFAALIFHATLSIVALVYALKQINTGRWQVFSHTAGSLLAGYLFRWQMLGAHLALAALGWWLTRWPWLVGAAVIFPVSRLSLLVVMGLGLIKPPRLKVGPVGKAGPQPSDDKVDTGESTEWS